MHRRGRRRRRRWPSSSRSSRSGCPAPTDFPLFSGFVLGTGELLGIYVLLGVTGCVVGATGAGVAVTRFLDV